MTGAVFQPELIDLMRSALEEATAMLPESKRTSTIRADMASVILARAAQGEHDPIALKAAAISTIMDRSHHSHDISEKSTIV